MRTPTADQLGRVSDPGAHAATAGPAQLLDDDERPANYSPRETRSYRAVDYAHAAPGPATDGRMGSLPEAHSTAGQPDPRKVWGGSAGHTGATHESLRPSPEVIDNSRVLVDVDTLAAPDRPRAGSTGADPARESRMPRWLYFRPFDRWAQYGAAALDKIEQPSPVASRPLAFAAPLAGALPSSGGAGATDTQPWDDTPNTVRLLPQPWDTTTITASSDSSATNEARTRAQGWGLR